MVSVVAFHATWQEEHVKNHVNKNYIMLYIIIQFILAVKYINNLELNTLKTVEMILDFRRNPPALPPLTSWTALWLQWSHSDSWAAPSPKTWSGTITDYIVKKAQQRLYFLCQLRKFNLPQELLKKFYSAIIVSVLCTSITVWFSSATKSDLRRLQRESLVQLFLLPKNCTYPEWAKGLAKLLWTHHIQHTPSLNCSKSGRRYRALSTRTARHRNSLFPQAIHLMNTWLENKFLVCVNIPGNNADSDSITWTFEMKS